jgi:hypothetical protein
VKRVEAIAAQERASWAELVIAKEEGAGDSGEPAE